MSKTIRSQVIEGRIRWMMGELKIPAGTPYAEAAKRIALHFGIPLLGRNEAKRKRYIGRMIRERRPDCPTKKTLVPADVRQARHRSMLAIRTITVDKHPKITRPTERLIRAFYESWDWKRLSYDVKLARGRKCECCGAVAPAVRIVTDHIKPLRHYWHLRFDPKNLQVLCDDCNMGKGSRDESDFRLADRVPALDSAEDARSVLDGEMPPDKPVIWN